MLAAMGRETRCLCRVGDAVAEALVLLETHEIILRGGIKRRFPLASVEAVRTEGEDLAFEADGEAVRLTLGAGQARTWAAALAKPPPSLASKLGLGGQMKAWAIGPLSDPALAAGLGDRLAETPGEAAICVAEVDGGEALDRAIAAYQAHALGKPLWVVFAKGAGAAFGEGPVRAQMRQAGFIDTKISAVSAARTATRFNLR
jgi:hypothetical protein